MSDHETLTDAEADAILNKIRNAEPVLTDEQVDTIEESFRDIGVTRRIALASLACPGSDLVEGIEGDHDIAVAFAGAAACAEDHIVKMRAAADLIETFKARIDVALCLRDDYDDVLAKADAEVTRESETRGGAA